MKKTTWHFLSDSLHREFGDHPEKRFSCAAVIKQNASRKVLKARGLYLNLEHRAFHSFRRESKIARKLNDAGFPTIEMIAYGKVNGDFALLTRELAQSVALDAWLKDQPPTQEMRQALTEFVRKWIVSRFVHRDFHAGNLLCIPAENRFVFVDLHAIHKKRFWRRRPDYEAARIFLALRRWLPRKEISPMIAEAGVPDAERFYDYALKKESRILLGEWSKRKKQILHGYPKYSRIESDRLIAIDAPALQQPEHQRNGRNYFLAHVFLNIAAIPHRQVAELDLLTNEALLSPRPVVMSPPSPALCDEMRERLALYGIESRPQDWSAVPGEALPVLIDLSPVVSAIERWEKVGL